MQDALAFNLQINKQLQQDEGLRLKPYKDTVGKLTIGYGRNLDDEGITQYEAEQLLQHDVDGVRIALATNLPWTHDLDDARHGVLANMAFNMGIHGLMEFHQMLAAAQAGDYDKAADEMENSAWYSQVGARAHRLATQMRSGAWQFTQGVTQ